LPAKFVELPSRAQLTVAHRTNVKLPNAEQAVVADEKVSANWELLREALREIAVTGTADLGQQSEFGAKYEIRARVTGLAGHQAVINTVWIINAGESIPRLVTAHPD
jgi:hypothetical protein